MELNFIVYNSTTEGNQKKNPKKSYIMRYEK